MAFLFKKSAQVAAMQTHISQNADLYGGRSRLIDNMDAYYEGLELDTDAQKLARWKRTPFYIYYPKVISSFNSSIFKKLPSHTLPSEVDNIDLLGNSLNEYVTKIPLEVLKNGFCATIIDYNDALNTPFLHFISPEKFVSFRVSNIKGYPELVQFIYSETEEVQDIDNEFLLKSMKVHYVWDINQGTVRIRKYIRQDIEVDKSVYAKKADQTEQSDILASTTDMIINGKPLESLPIIIHGKESNNFSIERSVLQDVSDLNINLINRVVDQIEVLHLTAMPTPYITGMDPEDPDAPKTIGSSKLWIIGEAEAKVGLLEFTGAAYKSHEQYISSLLEVMAVQGAQILKQQGVSRETATSVLIRTGQETAIITSIVQNISSQIEGILKIYFSWLGKPTEDITYELNSDFLNVDMEPNAQIALVKSWLDGAISHESLFTKFKQGELVPSDRSFSKELELIKKNPPPFLKEEKTAEIKDEALKGSNLETGNDLKNTEI